MVDLINKLCVSTVHLLCMHACMRYMCRYISLHKGMPMTWRYGQKCNVIPLCKLYVLAALCTPMVVMQVLTLRNCAGGFIFKQTNKQTLSNIYIDIPNMKPYKGRKMII